MQVNPARAPFLQLGPINTVTEVSLEKNLDNVRENMKWPYGWLHHMEGFKVHKGDVPVALIGGGPSLSSTLDELRNFRGVTFACGSCYDYLIENNFIPTYCTLCDPDPIVINYLKNVRPGTIFLVATQCDPCVFEYLSTKNVPIYKWNCFNNAWEEMIKIDPNFEAVGGGCTVGLRTLSITIMFGYKETHFFGFDSCLGDNEEHHAYGFNSNEELGQLFEIRLDPTEGKIYRCVGYQMAQVQHYKDFYEFYCDYFDPIFHGDGLLPALARKIAHDADILRKQMSEKHEQTSS